MKYPPHIRKHIEALADFARLNNLPGIVVPAQGEAQAVRPMREGAIYQSGRLPAEAKTSKSPPGRWHWNSRLQRYELVIKGVFTAEISAPKWGPREWRLYGHPDKFGTARSHYAAQREVRKALRMLSSEKP